MPARHSSVAPAGCWRARRGIGSELRDLGLARNAAAQAKSPATVGIGGPCCHAQAFAHRRRVVLIGALALAGCASVQPPEAAPPPAEAAILPTLPPAFQPGEIVGRWGFAAFHKEGDRVRTEAAAKAQCNNPYVINRGPTGGVMMHLADDAKASELRLKGAPGGKTYVGPEGPPASPQDREVVSFDGRVLVQAVSERPGRQGWHGRLQVVSCWSCNAR